MWLLAEAVIRKVRAGFPALGQLDVRSVVSFK